MSSYPVSPGDRIAGKYLIERFIGEGAMGLVVAARHVELDHPVAIKFLLPHVAEHAIAAQRFRREARAAARIRGEHACRVLDVATLDDGVPYMVMEYLDGCDLRSELAQRGRLPVAEAVDYVLQACEALAEAHASGIVHRDLKPGNLFLSLRADGTRCLKVLDFGVSKFLADSDFAPFGLTADSTMIGSPLYMSPEQLESARDVDGRTDVWGLGVVLFELITGRTPFVAGTLAQLAQKVLAAEVPACESLGVTVHSGLQQVLSRALSKRREQRFATVAELARALVPHGPMNGAVSAARAARLQPSSAAARSGVILRRETLGRATSSRESERALCSAAPTARERKVSQGASRPRRSKLPRAALVVAGLLLATGLAFGVGLALRSARGDAAAQHTLAPQALREHSVTPAPLRVPAPRPLAAQAPAVRPADSQSRPGTAAPEAAPSARSLASSASAEPDRAPAPSALLPRGRSVPLQLAAPVAAATPKPPAHKPAPSAQPAAPRTEPVPPSRYPISDFGGRR